MRLGISVTISTDNQEERLRLVLRGLARQSVPASSFEVVGVVDGCTDGSQEMVQGIDAPYGLRAVALLHDGEAGAGLRRETGNPPGPREGICTARAPPDVPPTWSERYGAVSPGRRTSNDGLDRPAQHTRTGEWTMDRVMRVIAVLGMLVPTGMLRVFVTSTSGQVLPERAGGLGWVATACATLAAVLTLAQRAEAYLPCDILNGPPWPKCQYWGCYSDPYCNGAGSMHYWCKWESGTCLDMWATYHEDQYYRCYDPPGGC